MKYVIGNQKTYLSYDEACKFSNISNKSTEKVKVIICPSMAYLSLFANNKNEIGSQDIAYQDIKATTGEVTISQLKSMNISYAIVGHSERREYQQENNELISKKVKLLLENDMIAVLCVGETKEQREEKKDKEVILNELVEVAKNQDKEKLSKMIIAYEPIWSIGTGLIPTKEEIKDTISYIKEVMKERYQIDVSVLYGGSVNAKNIEELNKIDVVDGYLIGGASTKEEEWNFIVNYVIENE